jgi:hypothetical protein
MGSWGLCLTRWLGLDGMGLVSDGAAELEEGIKKSISFYGRKAPQFGMHF